MIQWIKALFLVALGMTLWAAVPLLSAILVPVLAVMLIQWLLGVGDNPDKTT